MFINLTIEDKEKKFLELITYAKKIKNIALKNSCLCILNDYKQDIINRPAGHNYLEKHENDRTHQCYDGGLLDHTLNVTVHSYNIGLQYKDKVDMDLIIFGSILHDIGKTKIFDRWNKESNMNANLDYRYLLVDHVYLGEKIVEGYLEKEEISEQLKYQALHIIATHMDTMEKHMVEAYIVSYSDSIDGDVENIISYPRNTINPIINSYIYESVNNDK